MADTSEGKSAAELQREIEMQRHRLEDTIDQIQEKLSPGQLVDEFLTYGTKNEKVPRNRKRKKRRTAWWKIQNKTKTKNNKNIKTNP